GEDRREGGADARRRAGDQDLRAFELHCPSFGLMTIVTARLAAQDDFSCDSCCAHEKMPFDIVDASSCARVPNTSARTACTPLSSGAACAASSARWPASRRSPAA